jgi:hypothetical protein
VEAIEVKIIKGATQSMFALALLHDISIGGFGRATSSRFLNGLRPFRNDKRCCV